MSKTITVTVTKLNGQAKASVSTALDPEKISNVQAKGSGSKFDYRETDDQIIPLRYEVTQSRSVLNDLIAAGETVQTLSAAGAVSLTTESTLIVTGAGALAATLAAGVNNQRKVIKMKTDGGGDCTLTPNALQGGSTLTFGDAGDFVELIYLDGKWNILSNSGVTVA